ncbi:MAG: hypothetical protein WC389_22850 [Lutibacter sp.]|jgi:hypothetical protein
MSGQNNEDKNCDTCKEHSGMIGEVGNIKKSVDLSTSNITRLFDKFEVLAEKFQDKFQELSTGFQNKLEEMSKDFQDKFLRLAQRPGWLVCSIIAAETTIIGSLLTFILTTHFK